VIGKVTEGMDVVTVIGLLGDPATEAPSQPVVVETIEIERR
jgi:cyclophilin family peptidyl-prolyl cis-trans isomerase